MLATESYLLVSHSCLAQCSIPGLLPACLLLKPATAHPALFPSPWPFAWLISMFLQNQRLRVSMPCLLNQLMPVFMLIFLCCLRHCADPHKYIFLSCILLLMGALRGRPGRAGKSSGLGAVLCAKAAPKPGPKAGASALPMLGKLESSNTTLPSPALPACKSHRSLSISAC